MVLNLKAQKLVDSVQGYRVCGLDPDTCSTLHFFILIRNHVTLCLHDGYARRNLAMHKHSDGKVAIGKKSRNVSQMRADRFQIYDVTAVVDGYLDGAAIGREAEMLRRRVIRRPPALLAVPLHRTRL